jgi:hypothetical protein
VSDNENEPVPDNDDERLPFTQEQYVNANKLVQVLEDISDVEFYMPDVIEEKLSVEDWAEWARRAYGEADTKDVVEEVGVNYCGRAACVMGWAILSNIVGDDGEEHELAAATGLTVDQVNDLCFNDMDKTRLGAAAELRGYIEENLADDRRKLRR